MDERVQEAKRRWLQSSDPDDERRYLQTRTRAGAPVPRGCLEVAAFLGDEVAREQLGDLGLCLEAPRSGVARLADELPGGQTVWLRATLAVLDPAPASGADLARRAVELARLALEGRPGVAREADEVSRALEQQHPETDQGQWAAWGPSPVAQPLRGHYHLVRAVGHRTGGGAPEQHAQFALRAAAPADAGRKAAEAFRATITAALLPWVLLLDAPPEGMEATSTEGHVHVFPLGEAMAAEVAGAVLAAEGPAEVVSAYLEAQGWKRAKARAGGRDDVRRLSAPDDRRRVVLREKSVTIEVRGAQGWEKVEFAGMRTIRPGNLAERLVAAARRAAAS